LDAYLRALLSISPDITTSQDVRAFFTAREGDKEMDFDSDSDGFRLSAVSHQSSSHGTFPQASNGNAQRLSQQSTNPYGQKQALNGYQTTSDFRIPDGSVPPSAVRSNNGLMAPPQLTTAASFASLASSGPGSSTTKIKVWLADANCVVIRMPMVFTFAELLAKVRDRWALEPGAGTSANGGQSALAIEYKDEQTQGYWPLTNEGELANARNRNDKLTLRVGLAQATE